MEKKDRPKGSGPNLENIDEFTKNGFKILMEATKVANALPSDRDYDFYKVHNAFNRIVNNESDKILRLMNTILHSQGISGNIRNKDLDEKTEMVIEANDDILEKVAIGIDEMNGIRKTTAEPIEIQKVSAQIPVNGSWNQLNKASFTVTSAINSSVEERTNTLKSISLLTAKNIIRPQTLFKDKVDNRNDYPWEPRIKEKPNSVTPLAIFLEESNGVEEYSHPYEYELDHFQPLPEQLKPVQPRMPPSIERTPLYEIETPEQLEDLLKILLQCTEFAIDLEHHSYRTFMGITCLMQISTKDADYLIDTFLLRDKLWVLNEAFTKPSIVKVFHGAVSDILWLQRDLSLYIVNMFDTHEASKQLEYTGLSLAYLLNRFCNVLPNKHFQLADWRIRPLPQELKLYARMDTHYLLYIYHVLKNELIKKANGSDKMLVAVLQQSTQICKKRYIKPTLTESSHIEFYHKHKRFFDNKQMYALKGLYEWRDTTARTEDESTGYVLPNHMLLQIAEALPREAQGILACCNPIPPLARSNLIYLHKIILKAREQSVVKPILKDDVRSRGSTLQFNKVNLNSPFHCPHDLSKSGEFRDDLPVLLTANSYETSVDINCILEKTKSMYSVFNTPENSDEEYSEAMEKIKNMTFLGPYERYKLVKPFIQAEEEKAAAEAAKTVDNEKDEMVEKVEEVLNNDASNEDRIAALHAHFVKVSKETPQLVPNTHNDEQSHPMETFELNETFVKMGGSKKRKHHISDDEDADISCNTSFEALCTSVPNKNRNKRKRKKGKGNLNPNEDQLDTQQKNSNAKRRKKQYYNKQKKQQPNNKQQFKPFDYSSVNFQQFQGGGANSANQPRPVKSHFKAKNKNNKFNRGGQNKSMVFNRKNYNRQK